MAEHPQVVRVRVYTDRAGETRWTGYAANHQKVANSGEGYADARDCFAAVASLFPQATVKDERVLLRDPVRRDEDGEPIDAAIAEGTWEEKP